MEIPFEGGCACGRTRFQCSAYPLAMYNCHCHGCQKSAGAPYVPWIALNSGKVRISGEHTFVKTHVHEDPHANRAVCAECGTTVFAFSETMPDVLLLNAMALDDPSWYCPVADIWTAEAQPWVCVDRQIPKVFKSPPLLGGKIV